MFQKELLLNPNVKAIFPENPDHRIFKTLKSYAVFIFIFFPMQLVGSTRTQLQTQGQTVGSPRTQLQTEVFDEITLNFGSGDQLTVGAATKLNLKNDLAQKIW